MDRAQLSNKKINHSRLELMADLKRGDNVTFKNRENKIVKAVCTGYDSEMKWVWAQDDTGEDYSFCFSNVI